MDGGDGGGGEKSEFLRHNLGKMLTAGGNLEIEIRYHAIRCHSSKHGSPWKCYHNLVMASLLHHRRQRQKKLGAAVFAQQMTVASRWSGIGRGFWKRRAFLAKWLRKRGTSPLA